MKQWLNDFNHATTETKQFILTIATILLIIFGSLFHSYGRLNFDRSYDQDSPPPSKIQAE